MIYSGIRNITQNFELIKYFIQIQFVIIILLTLYTAVVLKLRMYLKKKLYSLDQFYSNALVDEVCFRAIGDNESKSNFRMPPWYRPFQRQALKKTLLNHIERMKGSEREFVVSIYEELGFALIDAKNTLSVNWQKRLEAVINLNQLRLPRYVLYLQRLLEDQNEVVASSALLALMGTKHAANSPSLFQQYAARHLERSNILIEIAKNIAQVHGINALFIKVNKSIHPILKDACVAAIIDSKDHRRNGILERIVVIDSLSIWAKVQILDTLGKLIDPAHQEIMQKFVNDESDELKLIAQKWFINTNIDWVA